MNKYLKDYHVHSEYSFDYNTDISRGGIFDLCEGAILNEICEIAVTDHYDINTVLDGTCRPLDAIGRKEDIIRAKKWYDGRFSVLYGIEIGQPHQRDKQAQKFLFDYDFDFVIGSYHNNVDTPDFCYIDYQNSTAEQLIGLYENYLVESVDHLKWGIGRFSTLGHLGYPLRYLKKNGLESILNPFDEKYLKITREIFLILIKNNIALEVNTSGLRQGMGDTMPLSGMISLYLDMGGKMITVGSDSHNSKIIGADIENEYKILYNMGVRKLVGFENKNPIFFDI